MTIVKMGCGRILEFIGERRLCVAHGYTEQIRWAAGGPALDVCRTVRPVVAAAAQERSDEPATWGLGGRASVPAKPGEPRAIAQR